jgi:hypothetical protein
MCALIFFTTSSETFLILRRIQYLAEFFLESEMFQTKL